MTTPVPKPANPGEKKLAIAHTSANFVNVRTGPGTNYTDIGDIFNNSRVSYYPATNTNGWVWVEYLTTAGWVATSVVSFEDLETADLPTYPPTPYDGTVGIWHWKGQAVAENTIDELATNFHRNTPNVKGVWVKVGDGGTWQGNFDSGDMAIRGPDDLARWASKLNTYRLDLHTWIVMRGQDLDAEADIIIKSLQTPGVKSIILDVEPYEHYWEVGPEPIRPLMTKIRDAVGPDKHIGLGVDPRKWHYANIYPDQWKPFVDSVHTMCYWTTFRRTVADVLDETYRVWGDYGKPIIPILQGVGTVLEQQEALQLATSIYGAKAVSWWRYGVIGRWDAVNTTIVIDSTDGTTEPGEQPQETQYGQEIVIYAGGNGHRRGTYTGQEEFQPFTNVNNLQSYYVTTEETTSKVWSEWKANLPESGNYQISVYIPGRHATTKKARYKIHGIRGTNTEVIVDLNQSIYRNVWVPLGVFDLVKGQENAGKVFLNDVTGESGREIAFDAIRLRRIVKLSTPTDPVDETEDIPEIINGVYVADGYDAPVGSDEDRGGDLWPPGWADASPFGRLYFVGTAREAYHTGADLNWGSPYADKGLPTYAVASGIVVFAARLRVWGNVIIIRHDPLKSPTGKVMYSRYGHVQDMVVKAGDRVKRGQKIAEISDAFGTLVPHLHFDLSPTTTLESRPSDWPGKDATRLFRDYVDPKAFIRDNRP